MSNYRDNTISVIEGEPGVEAAVFDADESPHGLAMRPTEPRLLAVANHTTSYVSLYDPRTLEKKGRIEVVPGPQDLVFSPDGKRLYVVSTKYRTLNVLDVDERKAAADPIEFERNPKRVALSADGRSILVLLSSAKGELAVIDPETLRVERRIPVGKFPSDFGVGNSGKMIVVASFDDDTFTVIDANTLEVTSVWDVETGEALAVHPTKPIAYSMVSFDDQVHRVDLETGETTERLPLGQWPTFGRFDPSGRYLYVPHEDSDSVVRIDTESDTRPVKIGVGREPYEVEFFQP